MERPDLKILCANKARVKADSMTPAFPKIRLRRSICVADRASLIAVLLEPAKLCQSCVSVQLACR
jgi:hypothetical protein